MDLAGTLSEMARSLEDAGDLQATLDAIVQAAVGTVPGADHVSISTVRGRKDFTTRAATSDVAMEIDSAQSETGEGPCLDTLYEKRTAHVWDTATERRWPRFAARSHQAGVGSLLSVQLYVHGEDLGALNVMSETAGAFDQDSEHVALLFASHAAVAMVGAQKEEQLRDALSRRDIIGQAMGILMERYDMTSESAFSLLTRLSQHSNRRVFELAEELIRTRGSGTTGGVAAN